MGGLLGCVAYQWGKVPSTHTSLILMICHGWDTHTRYFQCSGFHPEWFYPSKDSGQCLETFRLSHLGGNGAAGI